MAMPLWQLVVRHMLYHHRNMAVLYPRRLHKLLVNLSWSFLLLNLGCLDSVCEVCGALEVKNSFVQAPLGLGMLPLQVGDLMWRQ